MGVPNYPAPDKMRNYHEREPDSRERVKKAVVYSIVAMLIAAGLQAMWHYSTHLLWTPSPGEVIRHIVTTAIAAVLVAYRPRNHFGFVLTIFVGLIFLLPLDTGIERIALIAVLFLAFLLRSPIRANENDKAREASDRANESAARRTTKRTPSGKNNNIYGIAGSLIATQEKFGDAARMGSVGEKAVGKVLNDFADANPNVAVFHGLNFTPGKNGPDIDHAVVAGDHILLIDAKLWGYARYSWTIDSEGDLVVNKDGKSFKGNDVRMESAVVKWQNKFGRNVRSLIVLAQPDSGRYRVHNRRAPQGVELLALSDLRGELRSMLKTSGSLSESLVNRVAGELQ